MTTGLAFFVSIFFAPIFASIPSWATGPALVIVGALMMRNVLEINWDYIGDAIPAFLTIVMIPLTFKYASFPHFGSCLRGDKLTLNTAALHMVSLRAYVRTRCLTEFHGSSVKRPAIGWSRETTRTLNNGWSNLGV